MTSYFYDFKQLIGKACKDTWQDLLSKCCESPGMFYTHSLYNHWDISITWPPVPLSATLWMHRRLNGVRLGHSASLRRPFRTLHRASFKFDFVTPSAFFSTHASCNAHRGQNKFPSQRTANSTKWSLFVCSCLEVQHGSKNIHTSLNNGYVTSQWYFLSQKVF